MDACLKDDDFTEDSLTSQLFASKEKRRAKRVPAKWPVTVATTSGGKFNTVTENISESGILFVSNSQLKAGQKVHLRVQTYTGGFPFVLDAIAVLRHVSLSENKFKCGAEFIFMRDEGRRFVDSFVNNRNPHGAKSRTILG
tara:strand:- start:9610 stop:10032 length:423 start_codon:yes stop_codon:yes gene_type:complete